MNSLQIWWQKLRHVDDDSQSMVTRHQRACLWRRGKISISRHDIWSFYISADQDPIWTKLHMIDNSQGLNTSKLINLAILIAPPIGNRKFLSLHLHVPLPDTLPYHATNWMTQCPCVENTTLWRFWRFIKCCRHGNALLPYKTKYFLTV